MALQSISEISLDQIKRYVDNKRIVVLYPYSMHKQQFLSYFTKETGNAVLYYRMSRPLITLRDWLIESVREFDIIDPSTNAGKFLDSLQKGGSASDWAKEFVKVLKNLAKESYVLILDEFDNTPQSEDLIEFMDSLIENLPAKIQLVLVSRYLAYHPWIRRVNERQGVVIGKGFRKSDLILSPSENADPYLEVLAFGTGQSYINGKELQQWDGSLPRQLFFFLVDTPLVTRDKIFSVFWPRLETKEATNVFHVTKRKIGERLTTTVGDGSEYELTAYSAGFYSPSKNIIRSYDVAEFEQSIQQAENSDDEQEQFQAYQRAVYLYKGDFLTTVEHPWAKERRAKLKEMFINALISMGRLHKKHNEHENALNALNRVVRIAPHREDVHRDIMQIYVKLSRPNDAVMQYRNLEKRLKEEDGLPPAKETRALFDKIMADY